MFKDFLIRGEVLSTMVLPKPMTKDQFWKKFKKEKRTIQKKLSKTYLVISKRTGIQYFLKKYLYNYEFFPANLTGALPDKIQAHIKKLERLRYIDNTTENFQLFLHQSKKGYRVWSLQQFNKKSLAQLLKPGFSLRTDDKIEIISQISRVIENTLKNNIFHRKLMLKKIFYEIIDDQPRIYISEFSQFNQAYVEKDLFNSINDSNSH